MIDVSTGVMLALAKSRRNLATRGIWGLPDLHFYGSLAALKLGQTGCYTRWYLRQFLLWCKDGNTILRAASVK